MSKRRSSGFFDAIRWRITSAHTTWSTLTALLRSEIVNRRDEVPWRHRLRAYVHGLTTETYVLYGLQNRSPETIALYVNDFDRIIKPGRINGWFKHVLQDKLVFAASLAYFGFNNVPEVFGTIFHGRVTWRDRPIGDRPLVELLSREHRLVLKPIRGEGGGGVFLVQQESGVTLLNGKPISQAQLEARITRLDAYLIQRAIHQASYSDRIFPSSVNTIRIVTMCDAHTGLPFIAAAVHRFGTKQSMPVDNVDKGGLSAHIDVETGRLGRASSYLSKGAKMTWHETHPDTGAALAGVTIPRWEAIKGEVLAIAGQFPQLPIIGWDAVLDSGHQLVLLEGNVKPALRILQMHGPLLADPRVRYFYRLHGVIRTRA